jgi:esterase/lipase superfamily enzyme
VKLTRFRDFSRASVALILALACCACSGRPLQGVLVPSAESATGGSQVPILVATTRAQSPASTGDMFNDDRAQEVSYGLITISIPPDSARKIGQIQWPTSVPGDPSRDFVTVSADHISNKSFNHTISALARSRRRSRVLVFVHGFNNRFDEAVYRFAQIVHDSKVPVIPVLFSWPSRGLVSVAAYKEDVESANSSRSALQQLLGLIAHNRDVKEVTVLCHSMGCWPALEGLRASNIHAGKADKFKNVLLVAPDLDVSVFRSEVRQMGRPRPRVALFVSGDDQALKLSKSIWGGSARLGDANPEQEPYRSEFEREGILVFDLTHLGGDAHSRAFEDVTSVMGMIERRLAEGQQMTDSGSTLGDVTGSR